MKKDNMRILISTGHLGTAPSKEESFRLGMASNPDVLVADGGSADPGPVYLGEDSSMGMFERDEMELFLPAARQQGIPFIIGSAGDTGTNSRVDLFVEMVKDLAIQYKLPKFKVGYYYSNVPKTYVLEKLRQGAIEPLEGFPDLTEEELEKTSRVVALAGVHPFIKLLDMGADVIIGGRCGDVNFTAAPAIRAGFPEALAYHMGKIIECASLCATPFMGKETVIGTISMDDIKITPYHPAQSCTVASVAGHSMYERIHPNFEYSVGGMLDMSECKYEQFNEKTTKITGSKWIPSNEVWVKLEGAKKVGERWMGIAGIRDPYLVQHIDDLVQYSRDSVSKRFGTEGYTLFYHVFGKNGVMKELEPVKEIRSQEVCIVMECLADTDALGEIILDFGLRMFFLARLPGGIKGTAGAAATTKRPMKSSPGFVWSLNHRMRIDNPMELFPVHMTEAGL
jgi:hypothetical protein